MKVVWNLDNIFTITDIYTMFIQKCFLTPSLRDSNRIEN